MSLPKIKPCPKRGNVDVNIYAYDNGWRHVECDECLYLGPGEGNKVQAVKSHNEQFEATKSRYAAHAEAKP